MTDNCDNPDCTKKIMRSHSIPTGRRAFCSTTCREAFLLWVRAAELARYVRAMESAAIQPSTLLFWQVGHDVCGAAARAD
jgi:hypothetical protein